MKVILLKDIRGSGKKFDVKEVSDGYARNYLLPNKWAIEANKQNLAKINDKNNADKYKKEREISASKKLAEKLNSQKVIIYAKSGDNGKLFGAVTSKEIADEILKQLKIELDKKKIILDEPVKSLGTKIINIKLCPEVTAKIYLEIRSKS